MKALILSKGKDTGGQGGRIKQAFDRHGGDWSVRAVRGGDSYLRFPGDLLWDDELVRDLYRDADVVQFQSRLDAFEDVDDGSAKPVVIHWQGSFLRDDPAHAIAQAERAGAYQLVSTVDLLRCAPDARWLPSPYDLESLRAYRNPYGFGKGRPFVVAHAPTNRGIKGTDAVAEACAELQQQGYPVELDIIEQLPWKVCLSRKGRAHLLVDQLHLGYGNNAVEAWAMGVPVVCGVDDDDVIAGMAERWGQLPFAVADAQTLASVIATFIDSPGTRQLYADAGRDHVERYHDQRVVVRQLQELWGEMLTATRDEEDPDGTA